MHTHQSGSVLTVSLLILLVLTIIGVSALSNTVMEEKMSANFQNDRKSFQAAESAINLTLLEIARNEELLTTAEIASNDDQTENPTRQFNDAFTDGKTSQNAVIRYDGIMLPKNGSKINVDHANTMAWHNVKVTAQGTVNDTNARSVHVQGIMKGPLAR